MKTHDRMLYAGIRSSKRFACLSWFDRDLFYGLISVCDDYGRFEADADILRPVLYGRSLQKVSVRDVEGGLRRMGDPSIGLVKFYTVAGQGYGEVFNFRQILRKRRGECPDETGHIPLPEAQSSPPEGKKEENSPQPPAAAGGSNTSPSDKSNFEALRSRRTSRLPKLESLRAELKIIETEIAEILRPGGCSYNVQPTGTKAARHNELIAQRTQMSEQINRVREELSRQTR